MNVRRDVLASGLFVGGLLCIYTLVYLLINHEFPALL